MIYAAGQHGPGRRQTLSLPLQVAPVNRAPGAAGPAGGGVEADLFGIDDALLGMAATTLGPPIVKQIGSWLGDLF
jgi:hypothetical protein